jgi:hypothetical protein
MGAVATAGGFGMGYAVGAIPAAIALLAAFRLPRHDRPTTEVGGPAAGLEQPVEPVG